MPASGEKGAFVKDTWSGIGSWASGPVFIPSRKPIDVDPDSAKSWGTVKICRFGNPAPCGAHMAPQRLTTTTNLLLNNKHHCFLTHRHWSSVGYQFTRYFWRLNSESHRIDRMGARSSFGDINKDPLPRTTETVRYSRYFLIT